MEDCLITVVLVMTKFQVIYLIVFIRLSDKSNGNDNDTGNGDDNSNRDDDENNNSSKNHNKDDNQ